MHVSVLGSELLAPSALTWSWRSCCRRIRTRSPASEGDADALLPAEPKAHAHTELPGVDGLCVVLSRVLAEYVCWSWDKAGGEEVCSGLCSCHSAVTLRAPCGCSGQSRLLCPGGAGPMKLGCPRRWLLKARSSSFLPRPLLAPSLLVR